MSYLIKTVETYRVESEKAALELIENAKKDNKFDLIKYSCDYKDRKQKGEVIDAWYRVTLTKSFDDEKEPCGSTQVKYEIPSLNWAPDEEDDGYED